MFVVFLAIVLLAVETFAGGPLSLKITSRDGYPVGRGHSKRSINGTNLSNIFPGNRYAVDAFIGTPPTKAHLTLSNLYSDIVTFDWGLCITFGPTAGYPRLNSSTYTWDSNRTTMDNQTLAIGRDVITVAGHTVENQRFASLVKEEMRTDTAMGICASSSDSDGVFGINPGNQSTKSSPLLRTLLNSQEKKEIGIFLSDSGILYSTDSLVDTSLNDTLGLDGELMIGGTNRSLYLGDFTYPRVTNSSWFEVALDSLSVNGRQIAAVGPNASAELSPSDGSMFLPQAVVDEIFHSIPGSSTYDFGPKDYVSDYAGWPIIPCDSNVTLGVGLGNKVWNVDMVDLLWMVTQENDNYCILHIRASKDGSYNLGTPFMKTVYTQYTYDPVSVGIAPLAPGVNTRTAKDLIWIGEKADHLPSTSVSRAAFAPPTVNATPSVQATSTTMSNVTSPTGAVAAPATTSNAASVVTPTLLVVVGAVLAWVM